MPETKTMRTKAMIVRLPEDLHEGLRRHAFEERTSIADLTRRAVAEFLQRSGPSRRRGAK
ncbi:MAG: hypothetical protein HY720_10445 [Planctomycetes bacterium]|nr:hypothetical protein [Planctomycetota bacterium]